jgi:hypothetical protein
MRTAMAGGALPGPSVWSSVRWRGAGEAVAGGARTGAAVWGNQEEEEGGEERES